MAGPSKLDLHYKIAPEYYMYRERFELAVPEGVQANASYPPGLVKYDPTFEQDMEVYYGQVTVRIDLSHVDDSVGRLAGESLTLAMTSQGCADAGLCYPPETKEVQIAVTSDGVWSVDGVGVVDSVPEPLSVVMGGDGRPLNEGAAASKPKRAEQRVWILSILLTLAWPLGWQRRVGSRSWALVCSWAYCWLSPLACCPWCPY